MFFMNYGYIYDSKIIESMNYGYIYDSKIIESILFGIKKIMVIFMISESCSKKKNLKPHTSLFVPVPVPNIYDSKIIKTIHFFNGLRFHLLFKDH